MLIYRGGPLPSFEGNSLVTTVFAYEGAALRTIEFLQMCHASGLQEVVEKVIDMIKGHPPDQLPTL